VTPPSTEIITFASKYHGPEHDPQDEWVDNHGDIGSAPIVWARGRSPKHDRPFLEYFRDRCVWVLEPDATLLRLRRHPNEWQEQP
jgi:hypothetical protein